MNLKISYNAFPSGNITPVSSKSISNRALIIQALSGNASLIHNLSESDDTRTLVRLLNEYRTAGSFVTLDAGMAGTVMRFMTTFCCLGDKEVLLTGHERMLQRPIKELVDTLRKTGADIEYAGKQGFAPLRIKPAPIRGGKMEINAGVSSQFISSLMLCAPYFSQGLELSLRGQPVSFPYINMTCDVMRHFGVEVLADHENIVIQKGRYVPAVYTVEGDWSSAAYFYSMASLSEKCEIRLAGMHLQSNQADRHIMELAGYFGVNTAVTADGLVIHKKSATVPAAINENFLHCPDLAQTFAVMCAGNRVPAVSLNGLVTLSGKETDRILALKNELQRFGVGFYCAENDFISFDAGDFQGSASPVKTWNDHRMAMSFAPLAQKTGTVIIEDAQVVKKSYPRFWEDLKTLGCLVENADI